MEAIKKHARQIAVRLPEVSGDVAIFLAMVAHALAGDPLAIFLVNTTTNRYIRLAQRELYLTGYPGDEDYGRYSWNFLLQKSSDPEIEAMLRHLEQWATAGTFGELFPE